MSTEQIAIIRVDEIFLKGANQAQFGNRLKRNIVRTASFPPGSVKGSRGRYFLDVPAQDRPRLEKALTQVFGVRNSSIATKCPRDYEDIRDEAIRRAKLAAEHGVKTFKIVARRADKTFPYDSMELNRDIGGDILDAVPNLTVDVHHPDRIIGIDIRKTGVYVYDETIEGPGGLPVGSSGRALGLLSGGIDSPVAMWMAMKRGLTTDGVYFHAFPFTGDKVREKVLDLAKALVPWNSDPIRVFVPDFKPVLEALQENVHEPYWTISLRRMMVRFSKALADEHGYRALITGECIGQVASQTIENMRCTDAAAPDALILRPLCGLDKYEVINLAKRIETFDISIRPHDDCCSIFLPKNPKTKAFADRVEKAEWKLDTTALLAAARDGMKIYEATLDGVSEVAQEAAAN